MPKSTFFNLKPEKREKIENALVQEFSTRTFEEASISNIVVEAKIPRGSFYQYFEDKEDAIRYVVKKFIILEHTKAYDLLSKTNGDIFEASIKIYDYMIEKTMQNSNIILIKNIVQDLRKNNINIFDNDNEFQYKEKIDKIINKEMLNLEQVEDLKYIMKILTTVIRTTVVEVVSNQLSQEEGRKELIKEIEILKRGMQK